MLKEWGFCKFKNAVFILFASGHFLNRYDDKILIVHRVSFEHIDLFCHEITAPCRDSSESLLFQSLSAGVYTILMIPWWIRHGIMSSIFWLRSLVHIAVRLWIRVSTNCCAKSGISLQLNKIKVFVPENCICVEKIDVLGFSDLLTTTCIV